MLTYSGVPGDDRCECFDSGCSENHNGQCVNKATETLWRVDMDDINGTRFCSQCAEDAFMSGLFDSTPLHDEDEECE